MKRTRRRRTDAAVCTVIARNYLAHARVLARSLALQHPELVLHVLLVEPVGGSFDAAKEPFEVIPLEELPVPGLRALCMRSTVTELSTAVKPFLFELLLERTGCRKLLFVDPDVLVLGSLKPLLERLDEEPILVTPHILRPIDDDREPSELTFLRGGLYNLGFLGLAKARQTRSLLSWWKERLRTHCRMRPEQGLFVDQKWMDLAPLLFEGVGIVRDPGCNVAFWNLHERRIRGSATPRVNGRPLRFFHFSGYRPERPDQISRYQDRFTMDALGDARALFGRYRRLLLDAGFAECSAWPYRWDRFDNGVPVTLPMRDLFDEAGDRFGDPFRTDGPSSFFAWMNAPVAGEPEEPPFVSNLLHFQWRTRADLRARFPAVLGGDRGRFLEARREHAA